MFTGIVATVGRIAGVAPQGDGLRLVVAPGGLDISDIGIGDSIAVNGWCLTVVAIDADTLAFDVSAETLRCTAGLDGTADVNLEKALRLADRLGGHLMTGHVDGVGTVAEFTPVEGRQARSPKNSVGGWWSRHLPRSRASSQRRSIFFMLLLPNLVNVTFSH